jgi:hypothetical protein
MEKYLKPEVKELGYSPSEMLSKEELLNESEKTHEVPNVEKA